MHKILLQQGRRHVVRDVSVPMVHETAEASVGKHLSYSELVTGENIPLQTAL